MPVEGDSVGGGKRPEDAGRHDEDDHENGTEHKYVVRPDQSRESTDEDPDDAKYHREQHHDDHIPERAELVSPDRVDTPLESADDASVVENDRLAEELEEEDERHEQNEHDEWNDDDCQQRGRPGPSPASSLSERNGGETPDPADDT